ncbi:hypothetical protein F511_34597 [Dorcoceras hygrometricum]|uniref:Uncharacterized protein n=1 Tax=Dorcoceras hygrometricum TaxID=472368 RepID=A0A2Z7CUK3_9LAMI|nr:hypothetical protein F511_34597 [Dorcoceras hygrometricum]
MSLVNSAVNAETVLGKETDVSNGIVFRSKTAVTRFCAGRDLLRYFEESDWDARASDDTCNARNNEEN